MRVTRKIMAAMGEAFHLLYGADVYKDDFNDCASTYDQVITRKLLGEFTEAVIKELNPTPGDRCLDLGCGTGHAAAIIERLIRPDGSLLACDVAEGMLDVARKRLSDSETATIVNRDMLEALRDQADNSIDLLTVFWALGYSEPEKVLKEAGRKLARGGKVAVLVNTRESLSELQRIFVKMILKRPWALKRVPPINFPASLKAFERMLKKSDLETQVLEEKSCWQSFSDGASFGLWIRTSGPSAGFRGALRESQREKIFKKIEETTKNGISVNFRFIRYIGLKK